MQSSNEFDFDSLDEPLHAAGKPVDAPAPSPDIPEPPAVNMSPIPRIRITVDEDERNDDYDDDDDGYDEPLSRRNDNNTAWLVAGALAVILAFIGVLQLRGCIDDRGGDDTVIVDGDFNIDGVAVMVLEDGKRNPRDKWERGQVMTVQAIREWSAKHVTELSDGPAYRNVDTAEDLSKLDPVWEKLRSKAKLKPPSVLVVNVNRLTEFQLPEQDELAIKSLDQAAK